MKTLTIIFFCSLSFYVTGQHPANYDESKVPQYVLPNLLITEDGEPVKDTKDWISIRRPEILKLFETHVYGKAPGRPDDMIFVVPAKETTALDGTALRKEVRVFFSKKDTSFMTILITHLFCSFGLKLTKRN